MADRYNWYEVVVPSDTVNFTWPCDAIHVGGAGNITAVREDNVAVLFTAVAAGTRLNIKAKRINATGTAATNMTAMRQG